ncbi:hypothetical protein [Hungatella effluvii]|uniref:hypothetical protein n=1 Tax=Hungatella effluvii TaxID=1096246 RepID=UPI002A83F5A5|nr:hypothetical protein [Hungatella effluvii]
MRKSIKKVLALGITAVMALSLAACGGGTSGSTRTDGADKGAAPDSAAAGGGYSGKTLSIGIWGGNDQESAAINQVKADFEAKTGAKVEVKVYTDYNTQIQADFIAGTAPDAFYICDYVSVLQRAGGVGASRSCRDGNRRIL